MIISVKSMIFAVVLVLTASTTAQAQLLPCPQGVTPPDSYFPSDTTVDVWILDVDIPSKNLITPMEATGLSYSDVKLSVERAAEVWNEESGSSIRIRVQDKTEFDTIAGAVVITGSAACDPNLAYSYINLDGPYGHRFVDASIQLEKSNTSCVNTSWCAIPNQATCFDLTGVLIHEFGHSVYDLGHPDKDPDCTPVDQGGSVMFHAVERFRERTLKQWDLELAQSRYAPRTVTATIHRAQLSGANSWIQESAVPGQAGVDPLVRMGSLPQNFNVRYFGWVASTPGAQPGGTGYVDLAHYAGGVTGLEQFGGWDQSMGFVRPVALAGYEHITFHFGLPTVTFPQIVAFYKNLNPRPQLYTDAAAEGVIYYSRSSDGPPGTTLSPTNAPSFYFGISAAYDPYSNTYLVSYIADDNMSVGIRVIPTLTNTTTPEVSTILPISSLHAPSIACSGMQYGCMLVYDSASTSEGLMGWVYINVASDTGIVSEGASYMSNYVTTDTPSVAYWPQDDSYRVAYTIDNYIVYTYEILNNVLSGTGVAYYDFNSFISSPTVNPRSFSSTSSKLYVWFMKYW